MHDQLYTHLVAVSTAGGGLRGAQMHDQLYTHRVAVRGGRGGGQIYDQLYTCLVGVSRGGACMCMQGGRAGGAPSPAVVVTVRRREVARTG